MTNRYEQQMKKGVLDMLIMKLLERQEKYGYQLIQELKQKSRGTLTLKEGTLYPALYRLEEEGWIQSRWSEANDKEAAKKYYRLTTEGKRALEEMFSVWKGFSCNVEAIMNESGEPDAERNRNAGAIG